MESREIEIIIIKSVTGEANASELEQLHAWRLFSAENESFAADLELVWKVANDEYVEFMVPDHNAAYNRHLDLLKVKTESQSEMLSPIVPKMKRHPFSFFTPRRLASIAALFFFGMAAIGIFLTNQSIASENGILFTHLPDGSMIWLAEGSSVSLDRNFGKSNRNLTLDGKAFFDVVRDESRPFVITDNELEVIVLGTSFTFDSRENIVEVTSGKVRVEADKDKKVITANQLVTLQEDVLTFSSTSGSVGSWRNPNLKYSEAPIQRVVAELNAFLEITIKLEDGSEEIDCPFSSGGLIKNSEKEIISIFEKVYETESYTDEDGQVILSIIKC